jgi:hypothetical protein
MWTEKARRRQKVRPPARLQDKLKHVLVEHCIEKDQSVYMSTLSAKGSKERHSFTLLEM